MGSIRKGGDDMTPKTCPFCSESVVQIQRALVRAPADYQFYCRCVACSTAVFPSLPTEEAAIARWNNRPGERAAAEKVWQACDDAICDIDVEGGGGYARGVKDALKVIRALDIDRVLEDRT